MFTLFQQKNAGTDPAIFQGVPLWYSKCGGLVSSKHDPVKEIFRQWTNHWTASCEKCRRAIQHCRTIMYTSHLCWITDISVHIEDYRCPSCDTSCSIASTWEHHSATCSGRAKHVYPKNVYQLQETLFGKLDSFGLPLQTFRSFSRKTSFSIFQFEQICLEDDDFKYTESTIWIV